MKKTKPSGFLTTCPPKLFGMASHPPYAWKVPELSQQRSGSTNGCDTAAQSLKDLSAQAFWFQNKTHKMMVKFFECHKITMVYQLSFNLGSSSSVWPHQQQTSGPTRSAWRPSGAHPVLDPETLGHPESNQRPLDRHPGERTGTAATAPQNSRSFSLRLLGL